MLYLNSAGTNFSSMAALYPLRFSFLHRTPTSTPSTLIKCLQSADDSFNVDPESDFPNPSTQTTISADKFPVEKRRKSEIIRDRKAIVKPEPPDFEIGWKRTKPIAIEKPNGYLIMDFLEKLVGHMDREFGSATLLAKLGEIVAERAREEAEVLLEEGKVEERMVTELSRVLKLMEMVKAAVKQETFDQRLQQAKERCRQCLLDLCIVINNIKVQILDETMSSNFKSWMKP